VDNEESCLNFGIYPHLDPNPGIFHGFLVTARLDIFSQFGSYFSQN